MIMFFIGMVLLGINIATLGSGAATALGAINAATAIFTEFLGDAIQRAVFISDMQSQFSRILKSQREALFAYLKEEEEKKKKKKNRNDKGYSCADGGECDLACEITLNEPLKYKQIVAILKRTAFGEILSELYGIWLDEKYGKDGDEAEKDKKVGNLLEKAYKKIAKIKKERYLDKGEKKLFTMSELVDISLDEAWSGQQYLGMSKKYNSIDDPAEKKEYQNMWNWMLDTFQKKAVTTVLCKSEQLQLIAMAHILKTTREEPDEEKLADEIAERVVVLEKLLNMNPGGFTLREVEAGKSFVANYMVNNRCPECGYLGDGVFRDGVDGKRLLCAACGVDISFEQYAEPELYAKIGRMFDEKCEGLEEAVEGQFNELKTLFVESVVAEIRAQNAQIKDIFATHNEKLDAISSQLDYDSREKEMWEKRWDEFINEWQNGQAKEEDALDTIRKSLEESRDESRQKLSELWEQIVEINATTKNILAVVCENEEFSKETLTKIDELIKAAVTKECLDERLRWQTKDIKALLESYEQRSGRRMGELSAVGVARIIDVVKKTIKDSQGNINESKINDQTKILKQQSEKVLDAVNKYGKENHALLVNIVEGIDKIQSDIYLLLVNGSVAAPSTRIPDEYLLNHGRRSQSFNCVFCGVEASRDMNSKQECKCDICGNEYIPVDPFNDRAISAIKKTNGGELPRGVPTKENVEKWRNDHKIIFGKNGEKTYANGCRQDKLLYVDDTTCEKWNDTWGDEYARWYDIKSIVFFGMRLVEPEKIKKIEDELKPKTSYVILWRNIKISNNERNSR